MTRRLSKPRQAFHNFCARQRQTPYRVLFTYAEWYTWWEETGHWHQRGNRNDQYFMTRINRTGDWTLDNIQCITGLESRTTPRPRKAKNNGDTTNTTTI